MRFVDVRNKIGKAFCDYLLTGERKFWEYILTLEVPEEFKPYKEERIAYYSRFLERFKDKIPARDIGTVVFLGKVLNNEKLYFEGHEVIEKYWLRYKGEYKKFLQALIQVAIANMHLEGGNLKGYSRMKELALKNLEPYKGTLFGIDTERLREQLTSEGEVYFEL
jgi:predicted metal-dependent hydrolase